MIEGYRIPFSRKPPLIHPHHTNHIHTPPSEEMSQLISQMKKENVLQPVPSSPSFLSTMFLRPKPDGSLRPIFNLKNLNKFVCTPQFRLVNMHKVPEFLQKQDWMGKIDISQAYFHVAIVKSKRCFLRLIYRNELLEMTCLPFGLSSAPSAYASITAWIAQLLRDEGIRTLVYLDDFLLVHQDPTTLSQHLDYAVQLLNQLGWQINRLEFLGIIWNPWSNTKTLPDKKTAKIKSSINQILSSGQASFSEIQSLVGLLNFSSFAVPRGRLNFRHIQSFNHNLPEIAQKFNVPILAKTEMKWWLKNCYQSTAIHIAPPSHFLTTDASDIAWGARLDNTNIQGLWRPHERDLHCNQKELLAVHKAIERMRTTLANKTVMLQTDNRTVIAYIRNEGGTRSQALMTLTFNLFALLDRYNIKLTTFHIPGIYNSEADHLSRKMLSPEWHLLPSALETIFAKWGVPTMDLFASRIAHVVKDYCSIDLSDDQAKMHDAFAHPWSFQLAWVFPPPCLMPRVLNHLNSASGIYLVVAPRWERVFWRPDLKQRALGPPHTIWNLRQVLVDATSGHPPPKVDEMTLEVWRCGGGRMIYQTGHQNRKNFYCQVGDHRP
ncbi:unnamed protein product [Plutella xylostella]|uniref:(diamondback moth) hypothetical protein n=1 Tax=Plutella xylostella TaxID=51655 RepID=A0A8S4FVZ8_PLUXY|nr:unnamed protein product [Plutella xylostella]